VVERALIWPPTARIGPVTPAERKAVIARSPIRGKYDQTVDPDSAYEILQRRVHEGGDGKAQPDGPAPPPASGGGWGEVLGGVLGGGRSRGLCRPAKWWPSKLPARWPPRSAPSSARR
jgi:hypothetical protein